MMEGKNRELAISATSKIYEKVRRALDEKDSDKRWFWELLQNAKDTVVYRKGEISEMNKPNKQVSVKLIISGIDLNEPYVRFEHNGNPFKYSNHQYKYDDPKCLLLADSGKIEEDETQREDITGQFGTGFLSTHVLSLRILVEGLFWSKDALHYNFSFELDRQFENKLQLVEKVEKSLDQYDTDFKLSNSGANGYDTKFTYFLKNNKEGIEEAISIARTGINGIEHFIPFVLSFCKEIKSVEILDEVKSTSTAFFRNEDLIKKNMEINLVHVSKQIHNLIGNVKGHLIEDSSIDIAVCSNVSEHLDLAIELRKLDADKYEISPISPDSPVLFCTFPLIGSEKFRFPMMINCSNFYPRTERDGISLLTGKDNGNQKRLESSVELHKIITNHAITNRWGGLHWLALTNFEICPDWASPDWYEAYLNQIRTYLLEQPIVTTENKSLILLGNILCPFDVESEKFWKICYSFIGEKIPQQKDNISWNRILNVSFREWRQLLYTLDHLLKNIENIASLSILADQKFSSNLEKAIHWLNDVIQFIISDTEKIGLLNQYSIIPNQKGDFRKIEQLRYDVRIPEEFKDILVLFNKDKRENLIHSKIKGFTDHIPLNVEDISVLINKHISDINRNEDENFKLGMYQLASYFATDQSEKRNSIHLFAKDILKEKIPERKILAGVSDFNWDNTNKWMIKLFVSKIEEKGHIDGIAEIVKNEVLEEPTPKWLSRFIHFLSSFTDYKDFLASNKLTPNQYGELMSLNDLYDDPEHIPEVLKSILYDLSNKREDWKAILKHSEITIDLKKPKTIKNIAGLIDDLVKENRDSLENVKIRNAILSLVKWASDNQKTYSIEDLFKWFCLNKANLVLNTIDNGTDRDNIFEIIQSGKSLKDLASLAKSDVSLSTITQIADLAKSVDLDTVLAILKEHPELTSEKIEALLELEELSKGWDPNMVYDPNNEQIKVNFENGWKGEAYVYNTVKKIGMTVEWPNKSNAETSNIIIDNEGNSHFIEDQMNKYDIIAYSSTGNKSFIQVKTTTSDITQSDIIAMPISTREWKFINETNTNESYYLARVFNINKKPEVYFMKLEKAHELL